LFEYTMDNQSLEPAPSIKLNGAARQ